MRTVTSSLQRDPAVFYPDTMSDAITKALEFEVEGLRQAVERLTATVALYRRHRGAQEVSEASLATMSDTVLACCMYTAYCAAVGGRAYNGDLLPDWDTLTKDPTKEKIVKGWFAAVNVVRPETGMSDLAHSKVLTDLATARELLGQFTDLSVVRRGIKAEWFCLFCKDYARTPDHVKHKHNCLVARAKEHLEKTR